MSRRNRFVLDSQAVMAMLVGEPSGRRLTKMLESGEPWMTLVNLGEVVYAIERVRGPQAADDVYADFLATERPEGAVVRWFPVDEQLVRRAASLKASGGMSYSDCFAAAAAALLGCPVLTGNPEFRAAEAAGIEVDWL